MTDPRPQPIGPIDHVAVVVRSIDDSLPTYERLFGYVVSGPLIELPAQGARVCFLATGPFPAARLELVEPVEAGTGLARFLASRGEGLHHVCLRTTDLVDDLDRLAAEDVELINRQPRPGAGGQVAFIHPHALNGVLWELSEETP
jgi:methylmalonyl-CoA epimerase